MQKISRRNFVAALLIVLVWLGFVISGSHALLSESASLTGNTLTIGSAGLLISNSQSPNPSVFDASAPGFSLPLNPGDTEDRFFTLKNTSSARIALNIDMSLSINGQNQLPIASNATLDVVPVDNSGNPLPDSTGAGGTLQALSGSHVNISGFIPEGGTQRYRLRTMVDASESDPHDSITYDLILTGTQRVT